MTAAVDEDQPTAHSSDRASGSDEHDRSSGGGAAWMRALRDVAPYLDLGWRLAGTAAFPPLLGYALDVWLQTIPWFLLGGCAIGLSGAILQLIRLQDEFTH